MAASTKNTGPVNDPEVDKMFGDDDPFQGLDDLLDEVEEDDSEGWVPTEKGEGIVGKIVKIGETRSDFAKDESEAMCPTVTIETKDGTKYRVIGYGTVLRREMLDADMKVGGTAAFKYFGEKPIKKGKWQGKNYKHFGVAYRPPAAAVASS